MTAATKVQEGRASMSTTKKTTPTVRSLQLAVAALEAGAQACQRGATLSQRADLDPGVRAARR